MNNDNDEISFFYVCVHILLYCTHIMLNLSIISVKDECMPSRQTPPWQHYLRFMGQDQVCTLAASDVIYRTWFPENETSIKLETHLWRRKSQSSFKNVSVGVLCLELVF